MKESRKLGIMLKRLHYSFEAEVNRVLKKYDITKMQCDVLIYLSRNRERRINQRDIESYFSISNPTVSGILNRLESKHLIKKIVCEQDARNKYIIETDKAKELTIFLRTNLDKQEQRLKKDFSKEEEEMLFLLLEKLLININT